MKHILTTIFVSTILLGSNVANGQSFPIDQGSMVIGGGAGFKSSGSADSDRVTTVSMAPSYGYFVYKGLKLGVKLEVENQFQRNDSVVLLSVGPSVSYFFGNEGSVAYPFIEVEGMYSNVSFDQFVISGMYGEVSLGSVYMISRNVGAFASVYAQFNKITISEKSREDFASKGNEFGLRLGIMAFIF